MHASRFIDQVSAAVSGQYVGIGFFVTRLRIGQLGISHAGSNTRRQIVKTAHLPTGCHEYSLFTATAAHRAGTKVRHERPGTKNGGMTWLQQIDIHQARQHFCCFLHH